MKNIAKNGRNNSTKIGNLSHSDIDLLSRIGLCKRDAARFVSAEFMDGTESRQGLAIPNALHGYECFALSPTPSSQTHGRGGHVEIVRENERHDVCCVFYSIFDYFAYVHLRHIGPLPLPGDVDFYVMCHVENFFSMTVGTDGYDRILLFLPNTDFGRTLAMTIAQRNPGHVRDCSFYYGNYLTLRELCEEWIKKEIN